MSGSLVSTMGAASVPVAGSSRAIVRRCLSSEVRPESGNAYATPVPKLRGMPSKRNGSVPPVAGVAGPATGA